MDNYLSKGLLIAGLLLSAGAVSAQVSFGPRVGLNVSKISYELSEATKKAGIKKPDSKLVFGPQIGLAVNAQFGNLALQPAILFTMKGDKLESGGSSLTSSYKNEETLRLRYAEIPVSLVYSTNGAKGGFQVFAGPYVAFGLSGTVKGKSTYTYSAQTGTDSYKDDVKFASKEGSSNKYYVRGLDAGANLGIGYKVDGTQIQLSYGLGLSNLTPDNSAGNGSEDKVRNRVVQLTFGYFF
ncbi:porin family protein [Hymenobacter cavernae]|uniref:Outer membrane protein beta-barrel domain-containing protein n=1 Tax=Hymenobacter cavernae TaxID=2044852 RepID=A0ABQ1TLP8_9BACT|nr:porin family protein [Hymenobacter cavernae]GGE96038.1 hypothetical protein GCM10011383_03490 [Hymenobacter cavernae]